jgi:hypothetical protein
MLRNYDQILCCKLIALQTFDFTGLYLLPKNDVNLTQSVFDQCDQSSAS